MEVKCSISNLKMTLEMIQCEPLDIHQSHYGLWCSLCNRNSISQFHIRHMGSSHKASNICPCTKIYGYGLSLAFGWLCPCKRPDIKNDYPRTILINKQHMTPPPLVIDHSATGSPNSSFSHRNISRGILIHHQSIM